MIRVTEPLAFLTHEEFPPLSRVREVILSTQTSEGSYIRREIPDGTRIVMELTNLGISFCDGNRLTQAQEILIDAVRIQNCINHAMHPDLLRPLNALGVVYLRQCQFGEAEITLHRALQIAGNTYSHTNIIEEHRNILINLIAVYDQLIQYHARQSNDYAGKRVEIQRSLHSLPNPYVITDRHSRPHK
jgi:hypothetical protein